MRPETSIEGRSRETQIRRDADGNWFDKGRPVTHPGLVSAFERWVQLAEDGRYCLKNNTNWAYITLEGAPFFVRALHRADDGSPWLVLSGGAREPLAASSLRQDPGGMLYCNVRGGRMVARFDAHAVGQLAPWLHEDERGLYLRFGHQVVRPPTVFDVLGSASRHAC